MKAVPRHSFGDASVLVAQGVAIPVPQGNDILVRVKASGVNPIEWTAAAVPLAATCR